MNDEDDSLWSFQRNDSKYNLVIVIPTTTDTSTRMVKAPVAADSGVGSMSPSPPKTPTPDYDSLEDFCDDDEDDERGVVRCDESTVKRKFAPKKVHFRVSSWREALVQQEPSPSFCYRLDWVAGGNGHHPGWRASPTKDLDGETERKRGRRGLARRSSSLDRLTLEKWRDRTPLLCDPDPLKAPPRASVRGRRDQRLQESSSQKACPPLRQARSYSVEGGCRNHVPAPKKTPVRRVDEEALKRSRLHSSQYELSQDLLDKQVEMLERKYGGVVARQAALTIQRAFRKYTIVKRFRSIASASSAKRLSRRFPTFDLDAREWVDSPVAPLKEGPPRTQSFRHQPPFPRHPAWTAVPSSTAAGGGNQQRIALSQVQYQPSSLLRSPDQHHMALSPEDGPFSTVYPDGEAECVALQRGSAARHSVNLSPQRAPPHHPSLQRSTMVRASDLALGRRTQSAVQRGVRVPPQVPKRTSSIPCGGSELSAEVVITPERAGPRAPEASPVWKRKSLVLCDSADEKRLSNISENSEDSVESYSSTPPADHHPFGYPPDVRTPQHPHDTLPALYKLTEIQRKRQYRVGLNLFNKRPERGIRYLVQRGFLEASPQAVARFLLTRKGLSKQMIGEYLGNLQSSFNMAVLECFVQELDLAGMQVDVALRKFQTFFRMPGEAQKIERLVEVFSRRYVECNHDIASKLHSPDTVFVLAFAIIMLNTDLHTPNMKAERRMKLDEFIKNLRAIDDGHDLDRDMLVGIYERIKTNEFKMGSDHVTQVMKVQQTIVGKKPNLALPHRRLVCYCRLYEVYDVSKKERPGLHQREVFLFNDLLMVTKIFSKKKNSVTYTFRQSFPLCGMSVTLFEAPYYPHGIRLSQRVDDKVLITFNARNEHDRSKFVEDLKESILEMDEMENLRIEGELEKQKLMRIRGSDNRDSGVADMEIIPQPGPSSAPSSQPQTAKLSPDGANLKRSALSNSLLDLHDQQVNKPVRRGSAGSLDSGMSISFQSSAASSISHDSSPQIVHASSTSSGSGSSLSSTRSSTEPKPAQAGFLGGLFSKKSKHNPKSGSNPRKEGPDV